MPFSPYYSIVKVKTYFDHFSLNLRQLLTSTMKWNGLKYIWKLSMAYYWWWHNFYIVSWHQLIMYSIINILYLSVHWQMKYTANYYRTKHISHHFQIDQRLRAVSVQKMVNRREDKQINCRYITESCRWENRSRKSIIKAVC